MSSGVARNGGQKPPRRSVSTRRKDAFTILFVEDHPHEIRDLVCAVERHKPEWIYEVVEDARTAFEWLTRHRANVVVLDVMLPAERGVSIDPSLGVYLARLIRKQECRPPQGWAQSVLQTNRSTPIVLTTGRGIALLKRDLAQIGLESIALKDDNGWDVEALTSTQGSKIGIVEKASKTFEGLAFISQILSPLAARSTS